MATNPNKPWTIAYTIWEKNQANKAVAPVQPMNNSQVVSGWPQVTANAIGGNKTMDWLNTVQPLKTITPKINQIVERKPATVATPINPVISKNIGGGFVPNTSDIDVMDKKGLQEYIDAYSVKSKFGSVKEEDAIKAVKAQRMLNDMISSEQVATANPYEELIAQQEAERATTAQSLQDKFTQGKTAKEQELKIKYDQMRADQLQAWERQRAAAQSATSVSWFGRSTFNADQQVQIQKQTDDAVNQLTAAQQAEQIRYEMELQWASGEVLASLDKNIAELKTKATEAQAKALSEATRINQATGKSMEESITNLIATAQASGMDIKASDEGAITMLAQIVKGKDWKLNQDVLNQLPDGIREIVSAAAKTWYGTKQWEAAKTISIGSGKNERVMQWNSETGRYDIPVGGGSYGWGGMWWGGWGSGSLVGWIASQPYWNLYDLSLTQGSKSKLSQTAVENLSTGAQDAISALNKVWELLDAWSYTSWPLWAAAVLNPYATNTKAANQQFGIAAQVVGKFLEGGKLAEWDIKRYKALLPDISDTPEVAKKKLDAAKELIVNNYNWQLDSSARAWYNVSKYQYLPPFTNKNTTQNTTQSTPAPAQTGWTSAGKAKALSLMK